MSPIYTIGYGNRNINNFTNFLSGYGITILIDVRSRPYSRYNPNYNKETLKLILKSIDIDYLHMGDTLGGKPKDQRFYTNGKLNYHTMNSDQSYRFSIAALMEKGEMETICLMCAELNPNTCHRKNLISETLIRNHVIVKHIDQNGLLFQHPEFPLLEMF